MKQPAWKKILSYFTEFEVENTASDLNPDLYLSYRKGRYCLSTPNAIYSYGDLYENFNRAFRKMDLSQYDIQDVLVLGFGLGSIPFMLEKVFKKKYRYVGVERDEVIALWASKYVLPELRSPVELQLTDARIFAEMCLERFDLVIMDIFVDDVIPEKFESTAFLQTLQELLNEDGILLYNRLAAKPQDRQESKAFFDNIFKTVFPSATYYDVAGNWILKNR